MGGCSSKEAHNEAVEKPPESAAEPKKPTPRPKRRSTSKLQPEPPDPEDLGPVNFEAVKRDIKTMIDDESWDDGSLAPILIRLAWHASGTFDKVTKTGGSNNGGRGGATMRFGGERTDPENKGLDLARVKLSSIRQKHGAGLSCSDLWILASYTAIEHTGGPHIDFVPGRTDAAKDASPRICPFGDGIHNPSQSRLPSADLSVAKNVPKGCPMWQKEKPTIAGMRGTFKRMGMNDREMVALICGGHVYGRFHKERSGYAGSHVENMTTFSNDFAKALVKNTWVEVTTSSSQCPPEILPEEGKRQFIRLGPPVKVIDDTTSAVSSLSSAGASASPGGEPSSIPVAPYQVMLISDMALLWDSAWRSWLEYYADENDGDERLKKDFGLVFKRLTELGFMESASKELFRSPPSKKPHAKMTTIKREASLAQEKAARIAKLRDNEEAEFRAALQKVEAKKEERRQAAIKRLEEKSTSLNAFSL